MRVSDNINVVREERWSEPDLSWGAVLTMGFLHEGHLSLVRRAREENDRVSVSIFVNPAQFGSEGDLHVYPRNIEQDLELLTRENVDLVFTPSERLMYPQDFQTNIVVEKLTLPLEGASRPGHFLGVGTIVAKLFNILDPERAYFGQKDAQQVIMLERMVKDLNFKVKIVICPIVREPDGLALSSRNVRLSQAQRAAAPALHEALKAAEEQVLAGERDADLLRGVMRKIIQAEPLAKIDYVSAADPTTLMELGTVKKGVLLSLAVFFDDVRLIDNIIIESTLPEE